RLADLDERIRAADARRAGAAAIRERHDRLVELECVVPAVKELVALRDTRGGAGLALAQLRQGHAEQATNARTAAQEAAPARALAEHHREEPEPAAKAARDLEQQIKDDRNALSTAEEVARVDNALAELPADLDDRLAAADAAVRTADAAAVGAAAARAAA